MERIAESDVKVDKVLYRQPGKVDVYKVIVFKTGETICMKKIYVENIMDATMIQNEFLAMAKLNHKNILSLKSASLGGQNREITHVLIFMDYFEEGDLENLIQRTKNSNSKFSEKVLLDYLNQLVDAFSYMEARHIAHRDIKPQNIFITENGTQLKVGDLGSAVLKESNSGVTLTGTPLYLSPKLKYAFLQPGMNSMTIDHDVFKSDVYSLGLTFLYMASLKDVRDLSQLADLQQNINRRIESLPNDYSTLKKFLRKMLEVEEIDRMNFTELNKELKNLNIIKTLKAGSIVAKNAKIMNLIGKCCICNTDYEESEILIFCYKLVCRNCHVTYMKQRGDLINL